MRAVTDDAGSVVNEYSYDSYGQPETAVETVPQPFRFTGREYDPETGLSHYRSRAYDPSTSRFLQEDPIWFEAGDLNLPLCLELACQLDRSEWDGGRRGYRRYFYLCRVHS